MRIKAASLQHWIVPIAVLAAWEIFGRAGMLPRYLSVGAEQIRSVAGEVLRPDNRVVLTYLPDLPPADSAVRDEDRPEEERPTEPVQTETDEEVAA